MSIIWKVTGSVCPVCGNEYTSDADSYGTACTETTLRCDCGAFLNVDQVGYELETVGPHLTHMRMNYEYRDSAGRFIGSEAYHTLRENRRRAAEESAAKLDRALLLTCYENRLDAAPRLVLADWCAERGYDDWAAFWRDKAAELVKFAATYGPVSPRPVD